MTGKIFLDKKREETVKRNVFRLKTEYKYQFQKSVHCFYEGKDDVFYHRFIEDIYHDYTYYHYEGKGKDTVYASYEKIKRKSNNWTRYSKHRVLFFTDKDVDDYIPKPVPYNDDNIFETTFYSIENYLVNEKVFERILTGIFFIEPKYTSNFIFQFKTCKEKFYSEMSYISAWIIFNRKHSYNSPLEDVKLSDIFGFQIQDRTIKLEKNIGYTDDNLINSYLTSIFPNTTINVADVLQIKAILSSEPIQQKYIRGKFDLWFLMSYYNLFNAKLIPLLNKDIKKGLLKMPKIKSDYAITNNEKAMERFVSNLKMPNDLRTFLRTNYEKLN